MLVAYGIAPFPFAALDEVPRSGMRSLRIPTVLGVLLSVLLVGGFATASVPDSTGVIHSCIAKDGTVRVIDTATTAKCPKDTVPLNWNQTGPKGPAGPTGAQGPAGPAGASGYEIVNNSAVVDQSDLDTGVGVECPAGKQVFGGGGVAPSSGDDVTVWVLERSIPTGATGWRVEAHRFGPEKVGYISAIAVFAICANVS